MLRHCCPLSGGSNSVQPWKWKGDWILCEKDGTKDAQIAANKQSRDGGRNNRQRKRGQVVATMVTSKPMRASPTSCNDTLGLCFQWGGQIWSAGCMSITSNYWLPLWQPKHLQIQNRNIHPVEDRQYHSSGPPWRDNLQGRGSADKEAVDVVSKVRIWLPAEVKRALRCQPQIYVHRPILLVY